MYPANARMATTATPPTTEPATMPPTGVDEPVSGVGVGVGIGVVEDDYELDKSEGGWGDTAEELDDTVVVENVVDCVEEEVLVAVELYGTAPKGT